MKNNSTFAYALLLVVGDFVALTAAFTAAYILRVKIDERSLIQPIPAFTYLWAFLTVLPLWILAHASIGLYSKDVFDNRFRELGRILIGSFLGILIVIGYDFVIDDTIFPARLVPVYALLLGFGFLVVFRNLVRFIRHTLYRFNVAVSDVLIVGNTPVSKSIADSVSDIKNSGMRVIGIVGFKSKSYKHFADFASATKITPDAIIQTELYDNKDRNNEILNYAQKNHVSYRFTPGNSDLFVGKIDVELFSGLPVVAVHQTPLIGWGRIVKRIFDIVFGTFLIGLSSPILLVISVLQLLSGGDIFFRQKRLTRFNLEFKVYKFRTVRPAYNGLSPEQAFKKMGKEELIKVYRDNGDKLPNDPRYGLLGNFLRRTSLDELPQLFNVVKGDISLVGPRALVPDELSSYEKKHTILSVKSGLTGLAQVSGRRGISFDERRRLDMYYVQNWSFWLDIVILLKTVRVVIQGDDF